MKTINIKGNDYIPVNQRLIYFRSTAIYKNWQIKENIVSINESEAIFKVTILNENAVEIVSAHSQEYRDSSYINKTSFVENGFTSALGRALGYLGIGIDTSIASKEEIDNAKNNQDQKIESKDSRPWLTETQLVATLKGQTSQAENVLNAYKMKKEFRTKIKTKFNL
ncbi:MAG: hypothetical protein Unbinned96contig1002_23 [Prokaryotic dsDNA virus sp.]|nr:MAG: hypothetical protein Unbinned96contig1002_23 [Prokaryotic dsDNA virus sp.]|tara:strand:- start:10500 stop:11000 length:501 start_codon:yes stop_codon:yes gene_type:complete